MRNLWKLAIILFAACFLSSCNRLEELKTSLENNEVTIEVGKEVNVEVFAKEGFDVTWEVEDPSIVTVENGVFHAVSEGVTYVLVKSGDLETKIKVMVVLEAEE
ncbi:MAG TPA: Ig-like domain-containing protein, partial [Bacilli bacterium]|nr:Ig-like domain-containing protein [Bacilli bacterium]